MTRLGSDMVGGSVIIVGENSEEDADVGGNGEFNFGLIAFEEHNHSTVQGEKENCNLPFPARFSFVEAIQN